MLDDAHDDDGIERLVRLVVVEVGEQDVELVTEIGELVSQEVLRDFGVGDAGIADAGLQRVTGEGAPAGTDLQHTFSRSELAFLDCPVELPLQRFRQRLVVALVDALAVGGEHRIEEAQEQLRVEIVVRGDRLLVGVDLPEHSGLDEAPGRDQRMAVVERGAQRKRLQHVAFDVDVTLQIGFGDVALIQRAQRLDGPLVVKVHVEGGLALADIALGTVGQLDGERRLDPAYAVDEGVERACSR